MNENPYAAPLLQRRKKTIHAAAINRHNEADYEHQLAVDQESLADAEASEAVTVTAAESPLVANEVDGQAANDDAYSAALIADQGQEAITLAEADQTQEVALANAKANFTGQAYTNAVADANLGWVQSVAGAEALAATDDATAEENDVTGDASLEDGFAWSDAAQVDAQTKTDAAAESGQAQNDVSADAARQNADAAADVAFNTALYNETAGQWSSIAASVPLPWTQYRAGLASAEAGWYTANSGLYTSYIGDQATAEINYSIDDAGKYLTEADNVADDQQTEAQKMADAALTAANTQAADQYTFTQSMSTAWSDEQTGTAQLEHDYIENGNWAAMNAALATVKANWITGQSSALGTLETTDADAALVENQADLDAAKSEQEGTSTAELPQVEQYDDAESLAYANEQKADDLAAANYQTTWAASHAAALAAFDQANPSPWADEAAALAAANSTLQGSLATAQQTESDAEADTQRQDETSQTDAETQFQESQVSDEHDLAWGQAGNADAQVGSDALALETGASQNPNFTASPAALAPPPGVASPPVGGGHYADYTSVSQLGILSAYPTTITPLLSSYATGNFSSWLGWDSASPAGGSLAAETPNLSGAGTSLSDAAFAALALRQGEVQLDDPAVRADDAFTDADGTGNLPPMNPTPPALTPPGAPPITAPSTPPTPMSLEAAAAAPPAAAPPAAAPAAPPQSGGGTGSTGGLTQQPTTTGTSAAPSQAIQVFIFLGMAPISDLTALRSSPSLFDPAQSSNPLQQSIFSKLEAAQSRPQLFLKPLEESEGAQPNGTPGALAELSDSESAKLRQFVQNGMQSPDAGSAPVLLESNVTELEEAGYTFLSNGAYAYQAASGFVTIPTVICHGRNATGSLPGLTSTDSFVAGVWLRSGTNGDIAANYSTGAVSGLATAAPDLANLVVGASVFVINAGVSAFDGVPFDAPLFPTDRWSEDIRDSLNPNRNRESLITDAGHFGGQMLFWAATGEAVSALGTRGLAMLGPAAKSADGLPLLISESEVALNPVLFDAATPMAAQEPLMILRGAASKSELYHSTLPWAVNPDGARSLEEAIALARRFGVQIGEDVEFIPVPDELLRDAFASYTYMGKDVSGTEMLTWGLFKSDITGKVPIMLQESVLMRDEGILAVFGHEMHEINALRAMFSARGAIPAGEIANLITARLGGALHVEAVRVGDALVIRLRQGG